MRQAATPPAFQTKKVDVQDKRRAALVFRFGGLAGISAVYRGGVEFSRPRRGWSGGGVEFSPRRSRGSADFSRGRSVGGGASVVGLDSLGIRGVFCLGSLERETLPAQLEA